MSRLKYSMIAEATRRALERRGDIITKALTFANDTKRAERLEKMLCPGCAYGGAYLAGQAFTRWACLHCDKEDTHHNTHVPRLCQDCAEALALCRQCCADINLGQRRKVRLSKREVKWRMR